MGKIYEELTVSIFSPWPPAPQLQVIDYTIAALCIVAILAVVRRLSTYQELKMLPGPRAWPLIGHLHLLGDAPHQKLTDLARKYGPLMQLKLGSIPVLVVSSPDMAREVLKTQDHVFASRPRTLSGEIFSYDFQGLMWAPHGESCRLLRRTCQLELFTTKRINQFQGIRREEMMGAVQRLLHDGKGGTCPVLNLDDVLVQMNFNNITRVLFSKSYYGLKRTNSLEEAKAFTDVVTEWNNLAAVFTIGEYIPVLRRLDPVARRIQKRFWKLRAQFDILMEPIIEEHRQKSELTQKSGELDPFQDFLDVLIALQKGNEKKSISHEQIKGLLQDLIIGGTETGSFTVFWTMVELMRHPDVRRKVLTELDDVVGTDRVVQESDLIHLKYLAAVIKEALRLHPPVCLTPRETLAATKIDGYDIPAQTRVIMVIPAVQTDPTAWKNPLAFDPSRFLDRQLEVKASSFEFIPFGAGRRICPGLNMGMVMVTIEVAQLLHTCEFSLPEGVAASDVLIREKFGAVLTNRDPLEVRVAPRLPACVYAECGIDL